MDLVNFFIAALLYMANTLVMGIAGRSVLEILSKKKAPDLAAIPVLGIVLYSLYIALAGSFLGINKVIMNLPLVLSVFYIAEIRSLLAKISVPKFKFSGKITVFFSISLFVIMSVSFLRVFGTRIMGDSLVYHLYLPQQYVLAGYIFRVPFSEHALWPQLSEMYFTCSLLFGSIPAARFFSFLVYALTGVFTFLLIRLWTGKKSIFPLMGAAFILATPAFFLYSAETYVDLTITFFTIAIVYLLYLYYKKGELPYLIIAGVACAGTISSKYTAIPILISGAAAVLLNSQKAKKIRDLFLFCIVAAVFSSFWYLRSYIESANPIFPFGYNIFGAGFPSAADPKAMTFLGHLVNAGSGSSLGAGHGLYNFLMLPFDLTLRSSIFGADERIGFIFIALLPFFILSFFRVKNMRLMAVFTMLFIIQWFFLNQVIRFLFPILPLYVIMSVLGLSSIWDRRGIRIAFKSVISFIIAIQTLWSLYYFYQDFEYIFKGQPRAKYLDYSYRTAEYLKQKDLKGGDILLVGDNRVFYMPENVIRETAFRNFTHYELKKDPIGFLKACGIKYVFINTRDPESFFLKKIGHEIEPYGEYTDTYCFVLGRLK